MSEQPSLKERALEARRLAESSNQLAAQQAEARRRAESIQRLTAVWASLGVVVCACQVREDSVGSPYFVHESYRLGLGRYGGPAIWQEGDGYWCEVKDPEGENDPLEDLAVAYLKIDEWREKHRSWRAKGGLAPCDPAGCACCELDLGAEAPTPLPVAAS